MLNVKDMPTTKSLYTNPTTVIDLVLGIGVFINAKQNVNPQLQDLAAHVPKGNFVWHHSVVMHLTVREHYAVPVTGVSRVCVFN